MFFLDVSKIHISSGEKIVIFLEMSISGQDLFAAIAGNGHCSGFQVQSRQRKGRISRFMQPRLHLQAPQKPFCCNRGIRGGDPGFTGR